jgi:hypothetical protein
MVASLSGAELGLLLLLIWLAYQRAARRFAGLPGRKSGHERFAVFAILAAMGKRWDRCHRPPSRELL